MKSEIQNIQPKWSGKIAKLVSIALCIVLVALATAPFTTSAQTDDPSLLSETYRLEAESGTLLVNYPEGWAANGAGPGNIPYVALHNQPLSGTSLPTAMAQIVIIQTQELPITFDLNAENLSTAYFQAFKTLRLQENRGAYGDIHPVQFGDGETIYDGALMMLLETDSGPLLQGETKISLGLAAELDTTTLLIIEFQTTEGIFDVTLPLWMAMIETLIWNDVGLTNPSVRDIYAELEDTRALQQLYLEIQDQINGSSNTNLQGVDRSNSYSLQAGKHEIIVPRPVGWTETSPDDDQRIRFENVNNASTFLELRWLEHDSAGLSIPLSRILQQIALEGDYEVLDVAVFVLNDLPAAGISYRLVGGYVGVHFGLTLADRDGLLEIALQSPQPNWLQLQGLVFSILPELTIDNTQINFPVLLQAYQSLRNPSISN